MKRVIVWFIFVSSVLLSVNLARSVYDLSKRESIVNEAYDRLAYTREENEVFKKELEYVKSPAYIEKQARDKLNLARPGETIVIIPDVTPPPDYKSEPEKPVWKQWLEVFRIEI